MLHSGWAHPQVGLTQIRSYPPPCQSSSDSRAFRQRRLMPPKKAPLGDCTDALVSVEPGFASMGRGHMRAVRMDNPEKNATRVAYFLLPPGAVDDRPATVPEGATYWWKKKSALDPMSGGSRWSAQPGGDQGGQDSRCGQELSYARPALGGAWPAGLARACLMAGRPWAAHAAGRPWAAHGRPALLGPVLWPAGLAWAAHGR